MILRAGQYAISLSRPTIWVRGPWGCLFLKSPRSVILFSERYGWNETLASWRGWRLLWDRRTPQEKGQGK